MDVRYDLIDPKEPLTLYVIPLLTENKRVALHLNVKDDTAKEEVVIWLEQVGIDGFKEHTYYGHIKKGRGVTVAGIQMRGGDKVILRPVDAHITVSIVSMESENYDSLRS